MVLWVSAYIQRRRLMGARWRESDEADLMYDISGKGFAKK
jgi:hypothetical protein